MDVGREGVRDGDATNSGRNGRSGTGNVVADLLKAPSAVADRIARVESPLRAGTELLGCAALSHAVFGFAVGMFGGWSVALMDAVKGPLVGLGSLLVCFPSLYVLAALGGAPLSIPQAFVFGASCLAMLGFLLVGLAPVAWLFSVSTASAAFMVLLATLVWLIALSFAVRYVNVLRANPAFPRLGGIRTWFMVLALVTLQMTTSMRPVLKHSKGGWWTHEKQFFLVHFTSLMDRD